MIHNICCILKIAKFQFKNYSFSGADCSTAAEGSMTLCGIMFMPSINIIVSPGCTCHFVRTASLYIWGGLVVRWCWVKLPVPGCPTNLDYRRARAYCACSRCGWGVVWTFFLSSNILTFLSSFSLSNQSILVHIYQTSNHKHIRNVKY